MISLFVMEQFYRSMRRMTGMSLWMRLTANRIDTESEDVDVFDVVVDLVNG